MLMSQFKKGPPKDFFHIENQFGRMMRNMSLLRMPPLETDRWFPAADVYESKTDIIVYIDVSGVDPQKITVVAEESTLTVSGDRRVVIQDEIQNVHQLEIERGQFKRIISLPVPIDVSNTTSFCRDGFLIVRLPKQKKKGKVEIKVS